MKMGRFWLLWVGVCWVGLVQGQKHDYNWMIGYFSSLGYDSNYQHWFGISRFDFNQQPVAITRDSVNMTFDFTNAAISDEAGNLLFSSNGVKICNAFDEKIVDSLADLGDTSYFFRGVCGNCFSTGQRFNQYQIVLPNPLQSNSYDVFYFYLDSISIANAFYIGAKKILYTSIEANNNGSFVLKKRDIELVSPKLSISMAATKHANGKDWWIYTKIHNSNGYNAIYYNGLEGNITTFMQFGGGITEKGEITSTRFSPDGSIFASASSKTDSVNVFSFDRCSGTLNLLEQLIIPELKDSFQWWPTAIEFSPNSRFMYIFCNYRIFQFDLQANPIQISRQTVGIFDPTHRVPFSQTFFNAQLAPDGKIYVSSGNSNYALGVIDNPNGQGPTCNFNDTIFPIPTFGSGVPYYPNYRLGALAGSPCDTISSLNETERAAKEKQLKVFPNPATDFVTVDYGFTDWSKGEVSLEITNALGQVVYKQDLPMYSGFQKVHVGGFAAGLYQVYIKRRDVVVAAEKMVKE
ncbi:MAG: T9SS type A sorting domain-containing protein [Chitinophagales bacterium]